MHDGLSRAVAAGFPAIDPTKPGLQEINPFGLDEGDGFQTRTRTDDRTIERYADAMRRRAKFPPATVIVVDGMPRLVDGFHRLAASRASIGKSKKGFLVDVRIGSERDAFIEALTANSKHGLKLSAADDEKRFLLASGDPILRAMATRKLGAFLDISKSKIDRLRKKHPRTSRSGDGATKDADGGDFEPKRYSELQPPFVPHGPARPLKPLSPLAADLLTVAGGCRSSGSMVADALSKSIRGLSVDGKALDRAVREVMDLGVWLWKVRQSDDLLTELEEAERVRDEAGRDY